MLHDLGESGDVASPAAGGEPRLQRRAAQADDCLHRLDVFRAHLDAKVAPDAVPDAVLFFQLNQPGELGRRGLSRIGQEPGRFCQGRRTQKPFGDLMRCAGCDARPAHDAGIDVVKLVAARRQGHLAGWLFGLRLARRQQPGGHLPDLPPERGHVRHQVLDDRQILQGRNDDASVSFQLLADRGSAGQLLRSIDLHRTGAADGGPAGIAQSEGPVLLVLDADQAIQDGHAATDFEPIVLLMRVELGFGVESLDGEGQAHGKKLVANS